MDKELEEAAENYWAKQPYNEDAFIAGANWQAERMYSEKDIRKAYNQGIHLDIKDNKIELLNEDLECIRMYLDDLKIPRTDKDGNEYSIVGRIMWQQERMYSEEDMIAFMQFIISNPDLGNTSSVSETTARYYLEQFKKK